MQRPPELAFSIFGNDKSHLQLQNVCVPHTLMFTLIPPVIPGRIVDNAGKVAAVHPAVRSAIAIPIPIKTSRINHFIRRAFI